MDCDGCTKCCRWGGDHRLKIPELEMDTKGNCIHLTSKGCSIHDSIWRPARCKSFSCVELAKVVEKDCFMAVLMEGLKRRI